MDENGNVDDNDDERWSFKTFDMILLIYGKGEKKPSLKLIYRIGLLFVVDNQWKKRERESNHAKNVWFIQCMKHAIER